MSEAEIIKELEWYPDGEEDRLREGYHCMAEMEESVTELIKGMRAQLAKLKKGGES